jgi:hypothetical protein
VAARVEIAALTAPTVATKGGKGRGVSLSAFDLEKTVYIATSAAIAIVIN